MSISQRLDLRQSQTLVMTPQLQQAIKLLQMSNQELGEFVAEEIEQNPLLERPEDTSEADDVIPGELQSPTLSASGANADPAPLSGREAETDPAEDDSWSSESMFGEDGPGGHFRGG